MSNQLDILVQQRSQLVENHLEMSSMIEDHLKAAAKLQIKREILLEDIKELTIQANNLMERDKVLHEALKQASLTASVPEPPVSLPAPVETFPNHISIKKGKTTK